NILAEYPDVVLQRGILQLPKDDEAKRFADAPAIAGFDKNELQYLTAAQASALMQTEILSDALFWPRAAVIDPALWVHALRGNTPILATRKITTVRRDKNFYCRTNNGEEISARAVYVACGHAMDLIPEIHQQIRPRMGQISMVAANQLPSFPHAVSLGHYFIPSVGEKDHILGATYEHTDVVAVTDDGHQRNLAALQEMAKLIPALATSQNLTAADCTGRSAIRATTLNHLPLWGRADNGLFYVTGLGSRGLMSAPYAAQQLVIEAE
ncbi:MAG TPA: hypothetical protein DIS76_01970, partial [Rhodospirillaceae bacterium]|nr:hypothetical protein [Rhodospirillaceae bacterium]